MPSELNQDQLNALLALMTFDGEASNTQLDQRYGITLTGSNRTGLERKGYISCKREGNKSFHHELTAKGKHRCRTSLQAGPDPAAKRRDRIHQGVFKHLDSLLTASGLDVIGSGSDRVELKTVTKEDLSTAYFGLASKPGAWVSLTDLRSKLEGVERGTLDRLLHDLHVEGDITLIPEENRRSITPEDRASAICIGDEDRHLISIGRPL